MAIEKRIQLEDDAISAEIPTSEDITAMEDGGAQVTLTDQTEIDEADAMGLLDEEPMMDTEHDANLADVMEDAEVQAVAQELLEGFDRDKQSREEYDEIAEDGINLLGLQYGDSGSSVTDMQRLLMYLDFSVGPRMDDGIFGPYTKIFKKKVGLFYVHISILDFLFL